MRKILYDILSAICFTTIPLVAHGVTALSQYGQIQNVQNYSSNPFWSPGAPYNQRTIPHPVYATGPDVSTSDCQNIVANLVAAQCMAQNNCSGKQISDIRPAVMLELSRLPGHNFATACAGYIDSAFNTYIQQYANVVTPTQFPTDAQPIEAPKEFKIQNPYAPKAAPEWATGVKERTQELQQLQSQNGANDIGIVKTDFPQTINDVSFANRMENQAAGYAPYKDAKVYNGINIESEEKAMQRQLDALEAQYQIDKLQMPLNQYCEKYFDEERCPNDRGREQEIIAIGNNSATQTPPKTSQLSQNVMNNTTVTNSVTVNNNTPSSEPPTSTSAQPTPTVIANNRIHGGQCTASDHSNVFRNKILTTGKYEKIDPAFEKAMVQIFRIEGDCGSHPNDPGGYTCYGYAQNYNKDIDVRKLTRGGAEDRTYQRFYISRNIDKLPDSIRGDVLRGDFASGPGAGIKKLQRTLKLKETGKVDNELIQASHNFDGDLHDAYWDTMQKFYVDITRRNPKRKVFLKGWMNGVKLFRDNGCHVEPTNPLTR